MREDSKKRQKKYEIDMVHGPLAKKILLFAIPLMLSSMLQLLFNAADIIVVGILREASHLQQLDLRRL